MQTEREKAIEALLKIPGVKSVLLRETQDCGCKDSTPAPVVSPVITYPQEISAPPAAVPPSQPESAPEKKSRRRRNPENEKPTSEGNEKQLPEELDDTPGAPPISHILGGE